ncbi:MAG: tetratricopeptide repeat protein, partial [Bryobacterales bacterium]|nr:tetratricopeptide repeat protein [Bryobacterales bacterium]
HRDMKPGNVLFDAEDRPKLTDFGLAKTHQDSLGVTQTGTTVGTAAYLAPEQIIGADASIRTDIFSFGVLLYELFTGRRPFAADHPEGVFYPLLHLEAPAPLAFEPALPGPLSELILRCLRKDPATRPQSMAEVEEALRGVAAQLLVAESAGTRTFVVPTVSVSTPQPDASAAPLSARYPRWWRVALIGLLMLLAAIPIQHWLGRALPWNGLPNERKVAVLLFENLDGSPEQEAFCQALTDSLTAVVTQMGNGQRPLWVVPATEVRADTVRSIRDARRLFAINLAITGSLRRREDAVSVTLNLVDAQQGRQLEARTVQVALAQLPLLESRMADAVGQMLRATAPQPGTVFAHPDGVQGTSYELCMQGRGYIQRFDLPGNLDKAQRALESALVGEPRYALAHAGLAEVFLARHSLTQDSQWLAQAQQATDRALEINPNLSAARVNLCVLLTRTGRFADAIAQGKLARDLDPLDALASRALAAAYSTAGESSQAEQTYKQAIELQPGFWLPYKDLGVHYLGAGRFPEAEQMFRAVIDKAPDNEWGYRNLAIVFHQTGRLAEAEAQLQLAIQRKPTGEAYSNLGTVYYAQGRHGDAAQAYQRAAELSPQDSIIWGNLGDAWRARPETRAQSEAVYRKALELGERQLQIHSKDGQLLLALALYASKLGRHSQAAGYLARAQQLLPTSATLHYQAAIVHELAGQRSESLRCLRDAVAHGFPPSEISHEPELAALRADSRFPQVTAVSTPPNQ